MPAEKVAPDSCEREPAVTSSAYVFLAFLTLLNALNILDRNLIIVFANEIKADLHLSNGQFGLLSGLMFTLLYGLISPLIGLIADITHRPRLAAMGLALWSGLTAASGAARGFVSFAVPRVSIGVGESALTPPAVSMLADRFPARRMGFASGFYYAGVPLGGALAYLVAGTLGVSLGWRTCFFLMGGIGVVLAVVLGAQRDPRARPAHASGRVARAVGHMLALGPEFGAAMKRSPALVLTLAGALAIHFINGAASFDTLWWKEELHLATAPLFLKVALISATVGFAGSILGGLLGDWWLKTTGQGRPMLMAVLLLVLTPLGVLYRFTDHAGWIFWLGVAGRTFQGGAVYGIVLSTLQELVPARIRATTVAAFILAVNVFGIGVSSTAGGYLIDALGKAGDARPISHVLVILTALSGLAIPCFFFAARRFAGDRAALDAIEAKLASRTAPQPAIKTA
ncbi:MAG: MFS transporter [Phenylobacterium sp.]